MDELVKLRDQLSDLNAQLITAQYGRNGQQINYLKVRIAEIQKQIDNLEIECKGDGDSPDGRE